MKFSWRAALALMYGCITAVALAQNAVDNNGGVYTCVDASGRKLTSDRPIAECNDREQKVLNPSGTVKLTVGPSLTPQERAVREEKEHQEAEVRLRRLEEKRKDRALLVRYPTRALHDKERAEAMAQIADVVSAAKQRLVELTDQRRKIDIEMEFYKKEPSKAPEYLRHQIEDNVQNIAAQEKFLQEQAEEAARVKQRFDDELARLQQLWLTVAPR